MDSPEAAEIKIIITSLLISNPMRTTVEQLQRDFKSLEGRVVPFKKFGFVSFEEYLHAMPDIVRVYGSGRNAEVEGITLSKSEHINEMVLKQKKNTKGRGKGRPICGRNLYLPPPVRCNTSNVPSHYVSAQPHQEKRPSLLETNNEIPKMEHNPQPIIKPVPKCTPVPQVQTIPSPKTKIQFSEVLESAPLDALIPQGHMSPFSNVLPQSTISTAEESPKLSDQYNYYTDKQKLHWMWMNEENTAQTGVMKMNNSSGEICNGVSDFEFIPEKSTYLSRVPVKVQKNLKQLIQKFPSGIKCTKLPAEYRSMFKKFLLYEDYNYRSLIEMCSDLPDIFHYVQVSSNDYLLCDINTPLPILEQTTTPTHSQNEVVVTTSILEDLPKANWSLLVPTDVMTISDEIPRFFPIDFEEGDILDITVGEIYDLSKFWVYMTFGELDSLMQDLKNFFLENSETHRLPELFIEEGLYCVAVFKGEYHRCLVLNLIDTQPDVVRVFFIDFGTVSNISKNNMWFLPKRFGKLPSQAMRARLSNIYPVYKDSPWTAAAVARFERLVGTRVLVGEVTAVDKKNHAIVLYLADITNKDHVFYLNDVLVKEGHALYTDQEQKEKWVDPNCIVNVKYMHLYPEFHEIEAGLAPTTEEMKYIVSNDIPLHHIFPQYFNIYYREDIKLTKIQYSRRVLKKMSDFTVPASDLEEFDYSLFPASMAAEIKKAMGSLSDSNKTDSNVKKETVSDDSVKGYFCNKKRLSELIRSVSDTSAEDSTNFCDISSVSSFSPTNEQRGQNLEVESLCSNLEHTSIYDSDMGSQSEVSSTNPFRGSFRAGPSFHPTNPFLKDLENGATSPESSSGSSMRSQGFGNNNSSNPFHQVTRETNNPMGVSPYYSPQFNSSPYYSTQTNAPVVTTLKPIAVIQNQVPSTDMPRRVRTPPGFNSNNVNPNFSYNPHFANLYLQSINPYYQRMAFPQLSPNIFVPPTPPNFARYLPRFPPFQ